MISVVEKVLLYKEKHFSLVYFKPDSETINEVPIVLVPPLIAPSCIFDLCPEHSFARTLVDNGFKVYLIDFANVDHNDSHLLLENYILDFIYRSVCMVKKHSKAEKVTLLGYSSGGTLSIVYASLKSDIKNDIENVINIAGPVDFSYIKKFKIFFQPFKKLWFSYIDKAGFIPGAVLRFILTLSNPTALFTYPFYLSSGSRDKNIFKKCSAFSKFLSCFLNLPRGIFKQCFEIIESNDIVRGKLNLAGIPVDLTSISSNLLLISGSKDVFIPVMCLNSITKVISLPNYKYCEFPLGHLSIIVGDQSKKLVWELCAEWLKERSGSKISKDLIHKTAAK